ncbi:MAG: DMT family transporter [Firmicutes bacterium]|nr:DMT family transporter [Bacillota bacterium]
MHLLYALAAFAIGFGTSIQSGINGQIRLTTGNPLVATAVNFAVGTVLLIAMLAFTSKKSIYRLPDHRRLRITHWWMWIGGPLGVIYVMATLLFPPVIGYGAFFSMMVTGQMVFSAAIDHVGWFGTNITKISKKRLLGIVMLLAGAVLVQLT